MGIAVPWAVLMTLQAWKHGIGVYDAKGNYTPRMPEPYFFFWGSAAMGIAGVVAIWQPRLGTVLAWGLLIGAMVANYQSDKRTAQQAAANANPSSLAVKSATKRTIA